MKTYRNGAMLTVLVAMMVAGTAFGSANAATGIDIMLENDGNKVMVSGATGSSSSITMKITAPNGNKVGIRSIRHSRWRYYDVYWIVQSCWS